MTLDLRAVEARWNATLREGGDPDAYIKSGEDVPFLLAELRAARALLAKIAAKHMGCGDGFYACPRNEDYFGQYTDNETPIEQRPCYCWTDDARAVLRRVTDREDG